MGNFRDILSVYNLYNFKYYDLYGRQPYCHYLLLALRKQKYGFCNHGLLMTKAILLMLHPKSFWCFFHGKLDCKAERHSPFHRSERKLQSPVNKHCGRGTLPQESCRRILARERSRPLKSKFFHIRQQDETLF